MSAVIGIQSKHCQISHVHCGECSYILVNACASTNMWPFGTYPELQAHHVANQTYDYIIVGGK